MQVILYKEVDGEMVDKEEGDRQWALMNPSHEATVARCHQARDLCIELQAMITLSEWEHQQLGECLKTLAYLILKHEKMEERALAQS